ncbi:MAG: hypothetical protein GX625_10880 [Clostridiaceae bacterium]|nr:hypothetical protein [Clostridiaceae bacterium]
MKCIILNIIIASTCFSFALDAKDILGIQDIRIDSVNVEESLSSPSVITNSPELCSAVVYVLYGSAKENSTLPEAKLFEYTDQKVSKETIQKAKKFLLDTSILHINKSTRAMANMTIAFAFPNDKDVAKWLINNYFFTDASPELKNSILGTIRVGRYTAPETDLVVKAGLMSMNAAEVVNATSCIKDNPKHYESLLPDLVLSLLTLDDRNKMNDEFDLEVNIGVCYLVLTQAVEGYKDFDKIYFDILKKLSEAVGDESVKLLVSKIKSAD